MKVDPLSSPLEVAAGIGHIEIVEKLISAGAVINYQNKVSHVESLTSVVSLFCEILYHSRLSTVSHVWCAIVYLIT